MAINQELWLTDFARHLYDENDFYRIGRNWSSFVNGSIVHIPQALAEFTPQRIVAGTSLPLSVNENTYADLTFTNYMLAGKPVFVRPEDVAEASFDTRAELMKGMVGYLKQAISIEVMNGWTPDGVGSGAATGSVIRTTGTTTRSNIYGQASMKAITYADILNARATLIRASKNTNTSNLYLIVDPIMYKDLVSLGDFRTADELTVQTVVDGFVGMIGGIKVIQRTLGNPFTAAVDKPATLNYADTYDATHFSGALLVDGDKVGYALGTKENGEIRIGIEPYATGYYSDVIQAHTRVGASTLYTVDSNDIIKGVVSIIETA